MIWLGAGGADFVQAQKKAPSRRQTKTKPQKTARTAKPKTERTAAQNANLPPVTRVDFAGLQALLKREPEANRPLLINFWATWCTPCVEEFPELVKIDQEFRPRGLDFVTISLDDLAEINREVPKFLAQMKAEMPAYLLKTSDEDAAIALVAPDWKGGLPFTILLDATGKTAYSRMGVVKPDILRAELEKVLPAAPAAETAPPGN
jgi:thiol-disulfide isomerase/thioredoxin